MICRTLILLLLLGLFVPASTTAQGVPNQVPAEISPGQRVEITTVDGRKFKGKVEAVEGSTVAVVNSVYRGVFRHEEIATIALQKDSLWNGAIFGLAIGAAAGVLSADTSKNESPFCGMGIWDDCGGDSRAGAMAVNAGLGALVGAGVDALISKRDRYLFRKSASATISPVIGRRTRGVAVSVTW